MKKYNIKVSPSQKKNLLGFGQWPIITAAIVVALITFIVYLPALQNNFVNWDDVEYVYRNQHIQSTIDTNFIKWSFTTEVLGLWHPLTLLSLSLDHAIWGLNPFGFHLTNIVIHSFNTFLVFIVTIRLINYANFEENRFNKETIITGFITSLLFGIHPIHVESVAWVSERKDVLSAFFFLLSLFFYLKYISAYLKGLVYYVISLIFFIFSLMSKPMAVSLPIVFLILDYFPLKRLVLKDARCIKVILIEKIPFLLLSLLASLVTLWASSSGGAIKTAPLIARTFVATHAYIFYFIKIFFPFNLAPLYPYPQRINLFTLKYVIPFVIFSSITFCSFRFLKRHYLFSTIWFYYIITLIPVIGIIQVGGQAAADRYTYLPSLGPFILAGLGVTTFFKYSKKLSKSILFGILTLLSSVILINTTVKQIGVWHDSLTLWSHEINLFPDSTYEIYLNRGDAFDSLGKYQAAINDYTKSLQLNPYHEKTYYNRGNAYRSLGLYNEAIKDYSAAIGLDDRFAAAYINRGLTYDVLGEHHRAIEDYNIVISLDSSISQAYINRGTAYLNLGDLQHTILDYKMAIQLNPRDTRLYYHLGRVYSLLGNMEEARRYHEKSNNINAE